MLISEINVGDTVCVKSWDDMVSEFGLNAYGNIACKFGFNKEMSAFCGRRAIVREIDPADGELFLIDPDDPGFDGFDEWHFSADMLELIPIEDIKAPSEEDFLGILFGHVNGEVS